MTELEELKDILDSLQLFVEGLMTTDPINYRINAAQCAEYRHRIILEFVKMKKENAQLKELLESETFYLEAAQREITRRKKYE